MCDIIKVMQIKSEVKDEESVAPLLKCAAKVFRLTFHKCHSQKLSL